jgi:hypothetical protein
LEGDTLTLSAIADGYSDDRVRNLVAAWNADAMLRGYKIHPQSA